MVLAFAFSARRGLLPPGEAERVARHLAAVGLPTHVSMIAGPVPDADQLMNFFKNLTMAGGCLWLAKADPGRTHVDAPSTAGLRKVNHADDEGRGDMRARRPRGP